MGASLAYYSAQTWGLVEIPPSEFYLDFHCNHPNLYIVRINILTQPWHPSTGHSRVTIVFGNETTKYHVIPHNIIVNLNLHSGDRPLTKLKKDK